MWYAGVDWADDHHVVVVLDQAGQQVATQQVPHTVEGVAQLISFLLSIVGTPVQQEDLACIIETTHGLLITALLEAGFPVYPVNPKTVDRHRKPAGAKTDLIDAYLLARTGRSDIADLRRLRPDSALIQEREDAHARPGKPDCEPDAPGEPTDCLPQILLPRGFDLV